MARTVEAYKEGETSDGGHTAGTSITTVAKYSVVTLVIVLVIYQGALAASRGRIEPNESLDAVCLSSELRSSSSAVVASDANSTQRQSSGFNTASITLRLR